MTITGSIARSRANGKGRESSAASLEPDDQALADERRLMSQPMTADLSDVNPKILAGAVAAAFERKAFKLPCGCVPGVGMCLEKRDLTERIRKAKRRAAVRGDRKPLRAAMAEYHAHIDEMTEAL